MAFFTFSYWPDPELEVDLTCLLLTSFTGRYFKDFIFLFLSDRSYACDA